MTIPSDEASLATGLRDDAVALGRIMNAAKHRRLSGDELTEMLGIARTMVLGAHVLDRHIERPLPDAVRHCTIYLQFGEGEMLSIRKWSKMPFDGAISFTATSVAQLTQLSLTIGEE